MRVAILDQEKQLDQKRTELRKSEDSMVKAKKEAEKQSAKLKASSFSHPIGQNGRESELQSELDKCMVRCSTEVCLLGVRPGLNPLPCTEITSMLDLSDEHANDGHHEVYAL